MPVVGVGVCSNSGNGDDAPAKPGKPAWKPMLLYLANLHGRRVLPVVCVTTTLHFDLSGDNRAVRG